VAAGSSLDKDLSDETITGMVHSLKPLWSVETITRTASGTDFVASR
jgi:hypothetical protein